MVFEITRLGLWLKELFDLRRLNYVWFSFLVRLENRRKRFFPVDPKFSYSNFDLQHMLIRILAAGQKLGFTSKPLTLPLRVV